MKSIIASVRPSERAQDKELVERMLTGDESAYREIVDLYEDRLFSTILPLAGCRHDAEEIVQESFIKAFRHLPTFQHQSLFYTWLYRIAWNTSASRARKRRHDVSLESVGIESKSSAPECFQPHVPLERREKIATMRRALSGVEHRHRKILLLREFDELSYREISDAMDIPLGTVRSRLARARDRLREELLRIEEESVLPSRRKRVQQDQMLLAAAP